MAKPMSQGRVEMAKEADFLNALDEELSERSWKHEVGPVVGRFRPDVVAPLSNGEVVIIEVKTSEAPFHIGSVVKLHELADAAKQVYDARHVRPFILTSGMPSAAGTAVAESAEKLGITVVSSSSEAPSDAAVDWVDALGAAVSKSSNGHS